MEEVIDGILDELQMSTDPESFSNALRLLHKIVGNVVADPTNDKFRAMKKSNAKFASQVWAHTAAQQFLLMIGWEETDDSVHLPAGLDLTHVLKVLDARVKTISAAIPGAVGATTTTTAAAAAATAAAGASASHAAAAPKSASSCCGGSDSCHGGEQKPNSHKRTGRDEAIEQMRLDKLARDRIKQQIEADRRNTAARGEERASVARALQPGARITRFSDVGIDLNKKSG